MPAVALMLCLTLAAGWLRFASIDFGLPDNFRPDEEYIVEKAFGFGPNWDPYFASYPAGLMYVQAFAFRAYGAAHGHWSDFRAAFADKSRAYLIGREITAAFGTATVVAVYVAAAPVFGSVAAVSAAAIVGFSTLDVRESKFAKTDIAAAFWMTLAIAMLLRIAIGGNWRYYLGAGVFAGLGAATKYPAGAILIAVASAHLEARWREGGRNFLWRALGDARIYLAGVAAMVATVCASPYLVLNWAQTVHDFEIQRMEFRAGPVNTVAGYGWHWLLRYAMPDCFGVTLEVALIAGLLWAALRPKPGTTSLVAFLWVAIVTITTGLRAYYRYLVIPFPAMAILAGVAAADLMHLAESKIGRTRAAAGFAMLMVAILAPSVIRDVQLNRLLAQTDTRILARQWIVAHLPPGTKLASTSVAMFGSPQLPASYRIVPVDELRWLKANRIRWVISDSLEPLAAYSPGASAAELSWLRDNATLAFDANPIAPNATRASAFDSADAFYAPLNNITSMTRPGPRIRIWEVK
jgi:hypothetical protein